MNPEDVPELPLRIGYDRRRIVASSIVLLALATVAGIVLTAVQSARPGAPGHALAGARLGPVPVLVVIVEAVALLVVGVAVAGAMRRRDSLILREEGLEFHNSYGVFLVPWWNLAVIERAPGGYVGLRLRDRSRLLESHQGTPEQRELLATLEPFSGYDLILHPEELSCGVDRFVGWATELSARGYSKNSVCRSGEE